MSYVTARILIRRLVEDPSLDLDAPLEAKVVGGQVVLYAIRKVGPKPPKPKKKSRKRP